jgi:hypothetical protein
MLLAIAGACYLLDYLLSLDSVLITAALITVNELHISSRHCGQNITVSALTLTILMTTITQGVPESF